MQLKFYVGLATAVVLMTSSSSTYAQSENRELATPIVDNATAVKTRQFSQTSFGPGSTSLNSPPANDGYSYSTVEASIPETDYVSGNSRSLINLYCCGGRSPVKPPCKAVPNYGGNFCIGRNHGRPIFGRWCGF